jgi:CRISPR system Cascade subunit CasE
MNPLRAGTRRFVRSPQALHAAVLGGISRQPIRERVLWRLDEESPHRLELLVLSDSRPSWEHLVEQAGWTGAEEPQAMIRDYQPLLERIEVGREFAFRLRVNPVSSSKKPRMLTPEQERRREEALARGERLRGVRVAPQSAGEQTAWLLEHLAAWGFEAPVSSANAPDLMLVERRKATFLRQGKQVTLQTATFEGRIRVLDPGAARRTLLGGVGGGKAYGCGLLTLAPVGAAHPGSAGTGEA